ncbi:YniB family protein [Staphylococcus aureus]|uniref:YniB family protein n=1 Tax=Staphylococcus aureus TaxID=1280 RepID=UPI0020A324C3|nr:YniB family protein [Staphylococcus aureus]
MTYQQAGRIAVLKRIAGWVIFIPAVISTLISVLKFMYDHSEKQPGHQALALHGAHAAPGAQVQRAVRGAHGQVHVRRAGAGDFGDHGFGGRVDGGQALAGLGRHPLAVDKEVMRAPVEEGAGALGDTTDWLSILLSSLNSKQKGLLPILRYWFSISFSH